jgi:hypothetical protein
MFSLFVAQLKLSSYDWPDTLSRAYLKTNKDEVKTQDELLLEHSDIEVEVEQINMADYLVISDERHVLSILQFQYVYVFYS